MAAWLHQLLWANITAGILIALVCVLRRIGRRALGSRWLYGCWLLVALRLLLPVTITVPEEIPTVLPVYAVHMPAVQPVQAVEMPMEAAAKSAPPSLAIVLGCVWLAGVCVIGIVMIRRNARFRKALDLRKPTAEGTEALDAWTLRHGLRLPPAYTSAHIQSPCLVGAIRPRLVLPLDMPLHGEAADFALLHEACHARVGDTRWAWLRVMLCCVHWINPLVWLAARLSAADAELACDMRVMARLRDHNRYAYARTLVDAAQRRTASAMGVSFASGGLQARVKQIMEEKKVKKAWIAAVAMLMVVALGASFAVSEGGTSADSDWWIPAQLKKGAMFYRPVPNKQRLYTRVRVSDMGDLPDDALIVTRIAPTAWYVTLNGEKGRMYPEDLIIDPQLVAGEKGYIFPQKDTGIALYETPSDDGRVVATFYSDFAKVEIDQYGEEWSRIRIGENAGYVQTEYLGVDIGSPEDREMAGWYF